MKTLELFSGTESFSNVADKLGHEIFTVDSEPYLSPDLVRDINYLDITELPYNPEIVWASPPCTAFSVASIGKHWKGGKKGYIPKTEQAEMAIETVGNTLAIIWKLKPKYWFIENPRGMLRKMLFMQNLRGARRVTVTYCQYGYTRMKPTDIWTNCKEWKPRPMCKNGDKCHEAAPRGSRTGTQGINGARDRGRIPPALFEEIFESIKK